MAAKKNRADHRADTRGGALSGLPHVVSDSAAFLSLAPFDRCVLMEILRRFNGYNNGTIALTYEAIGDRLKGRNKARPNNARIGRSVARLIDHGFLAEPTPGSWLQRRAREYRLTFITSGKAPPFRSASNEYLQWKPPTEKNDGYAASPRKPRVGDAGSPEAACVGDAGSPELSKNGAFASANPPVSGDAGSLLIVKPYGGASAEGVSNLIPFPQSSLACEECGQSFPPATRGKPKRFCSERCRKRAEVQRRKARSA